jgi:hypothetical protein
MKIKSFKQFLNEFELEGEHHNKTGPFTPEDLEKVNKILNNYRNLPLIRDFKQFVNNLNTKYSNGEVEESYTQFKDSQGLYEINYWIYGMDHNPSRHEDLTLYEGTIFAFTDLEGGLNLVDEKFGWGTDMVLFNYDVLEDEDEGSPYGTFEGELNGINFDNCAVFHSVGQFQNFIQELETEMEKVIPELKKHILEFCNEYGIQA